MNDPRQVDPEEMKHAIRAIREHSLIPKRSEEELAEMFDPDTAAILAGRVDARAGWYEEELAERWAQAIPRKYRRATLDLPLGGQEDDYRQVREWATKDPRPNLLLCGPTGTGKSHLAVAAVAADFRAGATVMFQPVPELLDRLRPDGGAQTEDFTRPDRLLLDDFGLERPTEWSYERLGIVVNRRWLEDLPTIATTNLTPKELRDHAGERVYSRLCGEDAVVIALTGPDRRLA